LDLDLTKKIPEPFLGLFQDTVDRPIAFHPVFAKLTGSVTAGLLLSQAVYWTKRATSGSWFFKTIKQWEEETSLSRHEQETARKTLRRFSFWQEERRGVPARMYYRVDMASLYNELLSIAESRRSANKPNNENKSGISSSLPDSGKLDCGNTANKDAGKRQTGMPETGKHYKGISETTAETTSETTTTTLLSPLQPTPGHHGSGRDFVKKLLVGTMLQGADPRRIANVAKKYKRTREEIETAIDVLDQQYCLSNRTIEAPTALLVSALKDGVVPPEGYVPKSKREAEAEEKRAPATKKADEERRAKEAEVTEYRAAEAKLSALSSEERDEIFAKARTKLHPLLRNSFQAAKAYAIEIMMSQSADTS
jgi:hypothetical protein